MYILRNTIEQYTWKAFRITTGPFGGNHLSPLDALVVISLDTLLTKQSIAGDLRHLGGHVTSP